MKRVLCAAIALLIVSSVSLADISDVGSTVMVKYVNVTPGGTANVVLVPPAESYSGGVYAGIYNLTVDGVPTASFCIDLQDNSSTQARQYTVMELADAPDPTFGPMQDVKAAALSELLSEHWTDSLTNAQALALQVAIWEVVADYGTAGYGLSVGTFTTTTAVSAAQDLLNTIGDGIFAPVNSYNFVAVSSPDWQDYVVRVPAPAAVLLGLLGLATAGRKLRRFV